jgi:hypothetical protein
VGPIQTVTPGPIQVDIAIFERVAGDAELSRIESERELGRKLRAAAPDEFKSDNAARVAFRRARDAAGGDYIDGHWQMAS